MYNKKILERFDEEFGDLVTIGCNEEEIDLPSYNKIKNFLTEALESKDRKIKQNIGSLRQYLNERARTGLITNDELESFLLTDD